MSSAPDSPAASARARSSTIAPHHQPPPFPTTPPTQPPEVLPVPPPNSCIVWAVPITLIPTIDGIQVPALSTGTTRPLPDVPLQGRHQQNVNPLREANWEQPHPHTTNSPYRPHETLIPPKSSTQPRITSPAPRWSRPPRDAGHTRVNPLRHLRERDRERETIAPAAEIGLNHARITAL